ncbi:MAG: DUF3107 domain-containing protein [Propionibacteriaceae bacterium]|jgi:hypothetical protein|nr:DUF3107 domain-containing protein [Propionibacteriaceae bacterium]
MEVKVYIPNIAREVVIHAAADAAEVEKLLNAALAADGVLKLADEKGRIVLVPARMIGYLDIDQEKSRKVGFSI